MAQYLLALYYADQKISAEEFQRLCVDVPALDAKMEDAGVFEMRDIDQLLAASAADEL